MTQKGLAEEAKAEQGIIRAHSPYFTCKICMEIGTQLKINWVKKNV